MARRTRLTPELIDAIVKRVRVGVFPYIAAQAVGIPKSTFYDWMRRGEKGRRPFSELRAKVREAAASARSTAEIRVFQDRPFEWLRYGPGREKPDEPGWTESPQTLRVEGGQAPVQIEQRCPFPLQTLAAAFAELETLGFIQRTEYGQKLFESATSTREEETEGVHLIDVESKPSGDGSGLEPGQ